MSRRCPDSASICSSASVPKSHPHPPPSKSSMACTPTKDADLMPGPGSPDGPGSPGSPCGPGIPGKPMGPWTPATPWGPWTPGGPCRPWGPGGPCGPASPLNGEQALRINMAAAAPRISPLHLAAMTARTTLSWQRSVLAALHQLMRSRRRSNRRDAERRERCRNAGDPPGAPGPRPRTQNWENK